MEPESRFTGTKTQYERYIDNIFFESVKDGRITPDDKKLIELFIVKSEKASTSLSMARKYKLIYTLIGGRHRYLKKPFADVNNDELDAAISAIKADSSIKQNTKSDYCRILKRFYLILIKNKKIKLNLGSVSEIKVPRFDRMTKTAEMMLTDQEIEDIVLNCRNARDKAIIMLMSEGAFRVGEIASLRWNQVKFEDWGLIINVDEKTGKPRLVPCSGNGRAFLIGYMNDMGIASPPPPDELVFFYRVGNEKVQIQYSNISQRIKEAAERAGIQKHVTPHLFRHSAITRMIEDGLGETVVKRIAWGNEDSEQLSTYTHVTDNLIIDSVKARWKIDAEPVKLKERKTFGPVQCQCGYVNPPGLKFCGQCGKGLTPDAISEIERVDALVGIDLNKLIEEKIEARMRQMG
ncbi:MAG: site-specific integrase [Methanomicrobiales archaeon]